MTNNLKLQITTALDNAGIQATKQQINSLTSEVQKVNVNMGGFDKNGQKVFNKLSGSVGNFASAFGKVGGAVGVAYGSFQLFLKSFETANSFFQRFTKEGVLSIQSIKDGFKNLGHSVKEFFTGWDEAQKKRDEKLKEMQEGITNGLKSAIEYQNQQMNETLEIQQKITKEINNSTRAYITQANAQKNLNNAKGDEEIIGLQQNILDNVEFYRSQGQDEYANQLEIYGQWLIEQRRAAIEIDGLENDLVKQLKTAHSSEDLVKAKQQEANIVKKNIDEAKKQFDIAKNFYENQGTENRPESQKRLRMLNRNIKALENQYKDKQSELGLLQQQSETERTKSEELAYRLTNAQKRGVYQMDVIGTRFDQHRNQYGNLIDVDREYVDKAYGQLESSELLKEIVEELKKSREFNEQLLSFKQ